MATGADLMPSTWRSVATPTAIITATETMRPPRRTFRQIAYIHTYGQSSSIGHSIKASGLPSFAR
ncbi:hypothetical protein LCM4577_30865 [Mesorhizobium sp. LCM 4577]|nr:hypothetical protein LCM4577_30865 [Mesorhizobium sp. LCM 4577]